MTHEEARRTLAAYLAGRRVSRELLAEARALVQSDDAFLSHLKSELSLDAQWTVDCDLFSASVAELAAMTRAERERELPELLAHAESCPACRRLFWEVRTLWVTEAAAAVGARAAVVTRVLAEPIRLAVDAAGRLFELGLTPPSIAQARIAATAGVAPSEGGFVPAEPERKQWTLRDEEANVGIHVTLTGGPPGHVKLALDAEDDTTRPERFRVAVGMADGSSMVFSGWLADVRAEPLVLPRGSWRLGVRTTGRDPGLVWQIALELEERAFRGETKVSKDE